MTAKEMFEELGFRKNESVCYSKQHILYEKALDELSYPLQDSSCGGCKCWESDCTCEKRIAVETLQQLVDRATPKKANKNTDWYECPNCLADLFPLDITEDEIREIERVVSAQYSKNVLRYCPICGQALDWNDKD